MKKHLHIFELLSFLLVATCTLLAGFKPPRNVVTRASASDNLQSSRTPKYLSPGVLRTRAATSPLPACGSDDLDFGRTAGNIDLGSSTKIAYYEGVSREFEQSTAAMAHSLKSAAGSLDNFHAVLKSAENLAPETTNKLQAGFKSSAVPFISRETIPGAREDLADTITRKFSHEILEDTKQRLLEFGIHYTSSMDATYKLSEFFHSLGSGKLASESADFVAKTAQHMSALDFQQNTAIFIVVATYFCGSDQRRVGLERGTRAAEASIMRLEEELRLAKQTRQQEDDAEGGKKATSDEVEELRRQMENLHAKLEALMAARQDVTNQLDLECGADSKSMAASSAATERKVVVQGPHRLSKVVNGDVEKLNQGVRESPSAITRASSMVKGAKVSAAGLTSVRKAGKSVTKRAKTASEAKTGTKWKKNTEARAGGKTKGRARTKTKAIRTKVKAKTSVGKETTAGAKRSWDKLSESTLKRKTVKQLTEYLAEKGVRCIDESGKTLKKDSLVSLVLSR